MSTLQTWLHYHSGWHNTHGLTPVCMLLHPKSRGDIKLNTTNPLDHPIIDPNYFNDKDDLDHMLEGKSTSQESYSILKMHLK
jgi:choline dehydrogenase